MSIFAVIVRQSVARSDAKGGDGRWWWENVNITIRRESACNSDDDDDHLIILPSLSLAAA